MPPEGVLLADEAATLACGARLAERLRPGDVVTLAGPLGSGKTTLARGVLEALGLADEATSPTFPIVIVYEPPAVRLPVWHVDLYRIEDFMEAAELGLEDARAEAVLLIEWPERLGPANWVEALRLTVEPVATGGRRLTWAVGPSWRERWPPSP